MAADWLEALDSFVKAEWTDHGVALLLSRVPALLGSRGFEMEDILQGRKLRLFLETETEGRFKVIRNDSYAIMWGLVPAEANVSEPYTRYFRPPSGVKSVRFAPSAWKAFTLPIPEGKRRWLFDEPSIAFADHPSDQPPEGGYEVERRFIAPLQEGVENEVFNTTVQALIASWAVEKRIDVSRFALGRKRAPIAKLQRASTPHVETEGDTALDQLLGLLQPGELARISLPLDVVVRLRSTRPVFEQ